MAKEAAKKAILEAETTTLERLYAIQEEELRLRQRKRHLELQTDIAKAEAEEKAYAEARYEKQDTRNYFLVNQTGEDTAGTHLFTTPTTATIETRNPRNPVDNTSQELSRATA